MAASPFRARAREHTHVPIPATTAVTAGVCTELTSACLTAPWVLFPNSSLGPVFLHSPMSHCLPRICYSDTSCPQEDQYPPNIAVKVNHSYCSVPVSEAWQPGEPV